MAENSTGLSDHQPVDDTLTATLTIRRFNPETDHEPYWQGFDVQMRRSDRV